jgi:Mrp family chromosome partitioning ATPase
VKKVDPQILRRVKDGSFDKISKEQDYLLRELSIDQEIEDSINYQKLFQKAFQRKKLVFLIASLVYVGMFFYYVKTGAWYERRILVFLNSAKNSAFFSFLDSSSLGLPRGQDEDLVDFSTKALTNLNSDAFLNFCYEKAQDNHEIAKIFNLDLTEKRSLKPSLVERQKLKTFFETIMVPGKMEKSSAGFNKGGFVVKVRHEDFLSTENISEKITKIMKDYLTQIEMEDLRSVKKVIQEKIASIQKNLVENNDRRMKLFQSIPLVDKMTVYSLQSQLQATRIAISGNKVLESELVGRLANIERQINSIGITKREEVDDYELGKELASLSSQKRELAAQGIEKESFVYRNISESLSKALKSLEEQKVLSKNLSQDSDPSSSTLLKLAEVNKALDSINSYLNEKTRQIESGSELKNSFSLNFPENTNQKFDSKGVTSTLDIESVNELSFQLDRLRASIESNKSLDPAIGQKITKIEKKLNLISEERVKLDKNNLTSTIQDISNLSYLQKQLKLQGVDDDSVIAKRLSENLKKATAEFEKNKKNSLNPLRVEDLYGSDEMSLASQKETLDKLKGENSFYEAKVVEINKSLEELSFLLAERQTKEIQLADIDNLIKKDQVNFDLLNNSLLRMDIADIKNTNRFEFNFEPIQEKQIMPFLHFILVSLFLSFFLALTFSYYVQILNPRLRTVESFEELDCSVLGAVPSTKKELFLSSGYSSESASTSYMRLGIDLENNLMSSGGNIVLFTSADDSLNSASISLNVGAFFGSTGKKVLVVETDLTNNSVSKITGAPLSGGVSDLYLRKEKINFYPYSVADGLDVLTGDPLLLPAVSRLASETFNQFLEELKLNYSYIFLHVRPCLESPEASDLSRYASVSAICCNTEKTDISKVEKLSFLMKAFPSKKNYFILENVEDIDLESKDNSQKSQKKAA